MTKHRDYSQQGLLFFPYILRYMDRHYKHNYRQLTTDRKFCLQSLIMLQSLAKTYDVLEKKLEKNHHPTVKKYTKENIPEKYKGLYKDWDIQEAVKYIQQLRKKGGRIAFKFIKRFPDLTLYFSEQGTKFYFTKKGSPTNDLKLISDDGNTLLDIDLSLNLPLTLNMFNSVNINTIIRDIIHNQEHQDRPITDFTYFNPKEFHKYLTDRYRNAVKVLFLQLFESCYRLKLDETVQYLKKDKRFITKINADPKIAAITSDEQKIRQYFKTHKIEFLYRAKSLGLVNNVPKILHYEKLRHEIAHPGECGDRTLRPKSILHDFANCLYFMTNIKMPISVADFWIVCDYLSASYGQIRDADVDKRNLGYILDKKKSYRKNVEEFKKIGLIQKYEEEEFQSRNNIVHVNGKAGHPRFPEERLLHAIFDESLFDKIEKYQQQKRRDI